MQHFHRVTAIPQAVVFIGQERGHFPDQRVGVGDRDQAIILLQLGADIFEVEGMRPHQHRNGMRRRLERVMAAALHQAAANEGEVGNAVEQHQFTHGIANHHLGTGGGDLAGAAQSKAHSGLLHHLTRVGEALRMPRNEDQQQVREGLQQFFMRLQDDLFFAVVSAGGNPDLAVWRPLAAQRNRAGRQLRGDGDIEFQTSGDRQLVALQSESKEAVAILFILRGDKRNTA